MGTLPRKNMGIKLARRKILFSPTRTAALMLCGQTAFLWFFTLCGCEIRDVLLCECPSHLRFNFTLNNSPPLFKKKEKKKDFFNYFFNEAKKSL